MSERVASLGDRLPWATRSAVSEGAVRFRDAPNRWIVVLPHDACPACIGYVGAVAGRREELREWGAEAVVVAPGGFLDSPLAVIADHHEALREAVGVGPERAAVLVADRDAVLWHVDVVRDHGDPAGGLPDARVLVGRAKQLSIACPERETQDAPRQGLWDGVRIVEP